MALNFRISALLFRPERGFFIFTEGCRQENRNGNKLRSGQRRPGIDLGKISENQRRREPYSRSAKDIQRHRFAAGTRCDERRRQHQRRCRRYKSRRKHPEICRFVAKVKDVHQFRGGNLRCHGHRQSCRQCHGCRYQKRFFESFSVSRTECGSQNGHCTLVQAVNGSQRLLPYFIKCAVEGYSRAGGHDGVQEYAEHRVDAILNRRRKGNF